MSDTSASDPSGTPDPEKPIGPEDSTKPPAAAQPARWPNFAALAVALLAVGVAVTGWFFPRSSGDTSRSFTDQQVKDAKTHVCTAYQSVHEAVVSNTHLENPAPNDPMSSLAVATSARLALFAGGGYLRERLEAEPATPADLAKAVTAMANTLEELSIGYLAGLSATLDPLRHDFDSQIESVNAICK
ncbi:hypothetical protein [Mycobacterium shimoidei]|uniref:hypothetical protein n=1 Tax=Mycobacterium shimoidei TaxID=29313 RepID=UPI001E3F9295|nr:hypothetical protein [Mycobacterium shimoidei]